jgi:hypothetical protein
VWGGTEALLRKSILGQSRGVDGSNKGLGVGTDVTMIELMRMAWTPSLVELAEDAQGGVDGFTQEALTTFENCIGEDIAIETMTQLFASVPRSP